MNLGLSNPTGGALVSISNSVFFFSSRRRHTRFDCDWSSDVCSSDLADFRTALKPPAHIVLPPTGLVAIENTHNLGGGVVFPQADAVGVCAAAREAEIGRASCRERV